MELGNHLSLESHSTPHGKKEEMGRQTLGLPLCQVLKLSASNHLSRIVHQRLLCKDMSDLLWQSSDIKRNQVWQRQVEGLLGQNLHGHLSIRCLTGLSVWSTVENSCLLLTVILVTAILGHTAYGLSSDWMMAQRHIQMSSFENPYYFFV